MTRPEGRRSKPAGYPVEFERRLTLSDGRPVTVRPVIPGDAALLRRAIETADAATLRSRFLGGRPPLTVALLRYLTQLDYVHRFALAAFAPDGSGIAIGRYEGQPGSNEAEVAVAVTPAWRHAGLATQLVRLLGERALAVGISRFRAYYLTSNQDVRDIVLTLAGRPLSETAAAGVTEDVVVLPEVGERRS